MTREKPPDLPSNRRAPPPLPDYVPRNPNAAQSIPEPLGGRGPGPKRGPWKTVSQIEAEWATSTDPAVGPRCPDEHEAPPGPDIVTCPECETTGTHRLLIPAVAGQAALVRCGTCGHNFNVVVGFVLPAKED